MKTGTIDFAVFEDGKEYLGLASVTLPNIAQKMLSVDMAGVGGTVEVPTGKVDAMSATFNFHSVTPAAYNLCTLRQHIVELREAHQDLDNASGALTPEGVKYVMSIMPKSETLGQVQPASPQAVSGEYAVHSVKMFFDGVLQRHVDPVNNINWDKDNGNILAAYNKVLGK